MILQAKSSDSPIAALFAKWPQHNEYHAPP